MVIDEVFAIQKDFIKTSAFKEISKSYKQSIPVKKKQSQQGGLDFIYFKPTQRDSSMNC